MRQMMKPALTKMGARNIHHMVFVEDHTVITGNEKRLGNLRQALEAIKPKLDKDTSTLVKLNSGYYRPNKVTEFAAGEFNVDTACDLDGNKGSSGLWGNIHKVIKERGEEDVNIVILTNGADDCSRGCSGITGSELMMKKISETGASGLRHTTSIIGLDVTRSVERESISRACLWSGGKAVFLDCDASDDDGVCVSSAEAKDFFASFNVTDSKKLNAAAAASQKHFEAQSNGSVLEIIKHTPPSF
eukprot:TRINITY_DN31_c14_g1_i1.p1 TRINITY_DN31_c14_g1~~TRINITY_DN31_c14_g1_i1.p1  ORF type:complete len:264 (+),score=64.27 TRINITY_DN31_c14_g1_i1:58-792(+)